MDLKAVIFDWAGTAVDYGCFAPVAAMMSVLGEEGITVTPDQVRLHMGMKKRDHIGELFRMEEVAAQFEKVHGHRASETEIDVIYEKIDRRLTDSLPEFSSPIEGFLNVVSQIRAMGLKIGSTTGYTKSMMEVVAANAARQGYAPDHIVASDEVPAGRPAPWMCHENMRVLNAFPASFCVKVGDTVADIKEGLNAGMWSVGLVMGGSEMGFSEEEVQSADRYLLMKKAYETAERLYEAGAHYVAVFNSELPAVFKKIDARITRGETPSAAGRSLVTEGESNTSVLRSFRNAELSAESAELVKRDDAVFLGQALSSPCLDLATECKGSGFTLTGGRKVLDFHGNGVHQIGFGNEHVIEAVAEQMDTLSFCPRRYTNEKAVLLAEKLTELTGMERVLFAPAATLAVSSAIKLAMKITGKTKILSTYGSFHGASLDALSAAGDSGFLSGIRGFDIGENFLPYDSYRCIFGDCSACGHKCLELLEKRIKENNNVAAVMLEAVRCTTVHVPDRAYFEKLDNICHRYGVLKIFDETAAGLGRSGKWFSYQHFGIEPDMVVAGKGLGGGVMPLACLMARKGLDGAQDISIGHYTHEKNPVACVAGLAAIDFMEKEGLPEEAGAKGDNFGTVLNALHKKYSHVIGDVRHLGLMAAVEMDKNVKERNFIAEYVMYESLKAGLSFKVSAGSVLTLSPALTITEGELGRAAEILDSALAQVRI
ncbi:aspartate aminotransferase family protein [Seleniivibrio woodruffii]|uniref:aspartate aminotransferase family protein n=1 Tax=Seleniivibrio woodruffii TaxID=1078050 RepID=UPI0026EF1A34|nr:aspartate aminotransferase family protein [Seleniivibrio woodruffii]